MKRPTNLAFAVALGVCSGACGGEKEEQPPPQTAYGYEQGQPGQQSYAGQQQTGGQGQAQPYGQPSPYGGTPPGGQTTAPQPSAGQAPAPGQVPALGQVMADPSTLQNIIAGALSAGAASLGAATGGELGPVEEGIKMQAQEHARGAKPDGQLMHARLQGGAHAEGSATMAPGACYTIIGFGGPGVFEYQLNILTSPPAPPQVLAQSPTGSIAPVVGSGEQCIRNPYPVPMIVKVDMHVLRGQGMVGAQVYKK